MANELDAEAYQAKGIDPGQHKVFSITPSIHTFNQRFEGEPGTLPTQVPGENYDRTRTDLVDRIRPWADVPSKSLEFGGEGKMQTMPFNPDSEENQLRNFLVPLSDKDSPAQFNPKQFMPSRPEGEASRYIQGMGDTLADQLTHILKHPDMLVGTGELGATVPKGSLQEMLAQGMSYTEIANTLNMTKNAVAGAINRMRGYNNRTKTERAQGAEAKKQPYTPPKSNEIGDKEYEKALQDYLDKHPN